MTDEEDEDLDDPDDGEDEHHHRRHHRHHDSADNSVYSDDDDESSSDESDDEDHVRHLHGVLISHLLLWLQCMSTGKLRRFGSATAVASRATTTRQCRCVQCVQEVDVIFDDLEEDAMVGPLLGDEQLIMEHGGGEEGDTEVPAHPRGPFGP